MKTTITGTTSTNFITTTCITGTTTKWCVVYYGFQVNIDNNRGVKIYFDQGGSFKSGK